jgi:hypothetical protein
MRVCKRGHMHPAATMVLGFDRCQAGRPFKLFAKAL